MERSRFRDTERFLGDVESHIPAMGETMFRNVGTHDLGERESTFLRQMKTHVLDTWEPKIRELVSAIYGENQLNSLL